MLFPVQTYKNRRAELKKAMGSGLLVFLGNEESGMNYADNTYHFRQDSTFLYYFGLEYAHLAAVIDIDDDSEIIFGNELTIDDIVWMGTQPTLAEKSSSVGVSRTLPYDSLTDYVAGAVAKGQKVHFLPAYRPEHEIKLAKMGCKEASVPFILAVANMRNHKDEDEIRQIEEAVDISTEMHLAAYRMARPGVTEAQVAAEVERVVARTGNVLAFPTIATVQGQVLHNHGFIHTLKEGEIFLLDAGAENALHYAGDLSSALPVSERFDERQERIYNIHLASFKAAVDALKPGVPFRNAHIAAATVICEGMKELGLMKGNPADAAESGAYALFFPCGVGHMMGLDVHDMENLGEQYVGYADGMVKSKQFGFKSLRLARPLEPGFVFTVEPGIYFIPELMDKWYGERQFMDFINYDKLEPWRNFTGLRNELDYLITPDGARLLGTKKKPMTLEEVYEAKNS